MMERLKHCVSSVAIFWRCRGGVFAGRPVSVSQAVGQSVSQLVNAQTRVWRGSDQHWTVDERQGVWGDLGAIQRGEEGERQVDDCAAGQRGVLFPFK